MRDILPIVSVFNVVVCIANAVKYEELGWVVATMGWIIASSYLIGDWLKNRY